MPDEILSQLLGTPVESVDRRPLGGGCISDVSVVTIDCRGTEIAEALELLPDADQRIRLVLKSNGRSMERNFRCEAEGLRALAAADQIRVPAVYAVDVVDGRAYLAIEWIESSSSRPSPENFRRFGQRLAGLHRATRGSRLGWTQDNYLGSAPQPNAAGETWARFFAEHRIGFQLRWACDQGLVDAALKSDCQRIVDSMEDLLEGREDATSLLHGDLWSGNYLFDSEGQPALIDPAVYYGCREAEWGMIKWFGGCPAEFEQAYQQEWPMPDGWRRRVAIYMLYHQLNHLNLFGGSYAGNCKRTASDILR